MQFFILAGSILRKHLQQILIQNFRTKRSSVQFFLQNFFFLYFRNPKSEIVTYYLTFHIFLSLGPFYPTKYPAKYRIDIVTNIVTLYKLHTTHTSQSLVGQLWQCMKARLLPPIITSVEELSVGDIRDNWSDHEKSFASREIKRNVYLWSITVWRNIDA